MDIPEIQRRLVELKAGKALFTLKHFPDGLTLVHRYVYCVRRDGFNYERAILYPKHLATQSYTTFFNIEPTDIPISKTVAKRYLALEDVE